MIAINTFLALYLAAYLLSAAVDTYIDLVSAAYSKKYGTEVPHEFQEVIDGGKLKKMNAYTLDNTHLSLVKGLAGKVIFLAVILFGLLPWWAEQLKDLSFVAGGLIFFGVPIVLAGLLDLPFDYYRIFVIEERYGFNTRTRKVWMLDLLKSFFLAIILGAVLISLLLLMVGYAGKTWWIWAWLIFFSFQLLLLVFYPTLIAPIFNKFKAIGDSPLAEKIGRLAEREGIPIKGVFQMDAKKRSRHTNAYLSGLGKTKRIVLFDTLIESHGDDEILAVLAHEIGHLKRNHIKKQLFITGLASLVLLYVASEMVIWDHLYASFGFYEKSLYGGLLLVGLLWEPVGFFLAPLAMAISRRFEREADKQVVKTLESATPLITALKKMARDNLSNLSPHPLYVHFNYSHPPLLERIQALKGRFPQNGPH
ncbi:MAG: M48 family metallopeptidase [Desulfobacteraceae bacterium]|jgi:STE24 endopeptidase